MNKKQIISMWCGIVAILFFGFVTIVDSYRPDYGRLAVCVFVTALVTAGLIYTFRDKKKTADETKKPINLRRGFRRLTLLLAIVVALICVCIAVASFGYNRIRSQNHLSYCENELFKTIPVEDPNERPAGWPRRSSERWPSYSDYQLELSLFLDTINANLPLLTGEEDKKYREEHNVPPDSTDRFYTEEAVKFREKYGSCFEKARLLIHAHNFWVGLSAKQFISLLVLGGLGCAIAGFCGIWAIYGLLRWAIIPTIRWVIIGFRADTG